MSWKIFTISILSIYAAWYSVNILRDLLQKTKRSEVKNSSEWNVSNLLDDESPPKKISENTIFSPNQKKVQSRTPSLKANNTEFKYKEKKIKM